MMGIATRDAEPLGNERMHIWMGNKELIVWDGDFSRREGNPGNLYRVDSGNAITYTKGQGSSWGRVLGYNQQVGRTELDRRKWLYTLITRASKEMTLVDPIDRINETHMRPRNIYKNEKP